MSETMKKTCPRCSIPKESSEFYRCSSSKDGLQVWCKQCQLTYADKNKDTARLRAEEWRRKRGIQPRKGKSMGGIGTLFPELE